MCLFEYTEKRTMNQNERRKKKIVPNLIVIWTWKRRENERDFIYIIFFCYFIYHRFCLRDNQIFNIFDFITTVIVFLSLCISLWMWRSLLFLNYVLHYIAFFLFLKFSKLKVCLKFLTKWFDHTIDIDVAACVFLLLFYTFFFQTFDFQIINIKFFSRDYWFF